MSEEDEASLSLTKIARMIEEEIEADGGISVERLRQLIGVKGRVQLKVTSDDYGTYYHGFDVWLTGPLDALAQISAEYGGYEELQKESTEKSNGDLLWCGKFKPEVNTVSIRSFEAGDRKYFMVYAGSAPPFVNDDPAHQASEWEDEDSEQ